MNVESNEFSPKGNKALTVLVIILSLLVVLSVGYIIYDILDGVDVDNTNEEMVK